MYLFSDKIKFTIFIFTTFFILLTSCSSVFITDFIIKDYYFDEHCITIDFSSSPDAISFKKALILEKDGFSENYTIYNQNNSIKIYPTAKIEANHDYSLYISTDAENSEGKNLNSTFKWNFTTKPESGKLNITKFEKLPNGLTFDFNKPADPSSFSNSFSLNPNIKNIIYFQNNNTKASVIFLEPQKINERYFIKISSDFKDCNNNKLENDFTYTYIYNFTNDKTTYTAYNLYNSEIYELSKIKLNENILSKSSFKISFSNQIQSEYINSSIKISPPIDFIITKNIENLNELFITLNELPDFQTEYILSISDDILDINNIPIEQSEYHLLFNNQNNRHVIFENLIIQTENENLEINENKNYQTIIFDPYLYPVSENSIEKNIDFIFVFSISKNAEQIDYISAVENIKISQTLNCVELNKKEIKIITDHELKENYNFCIPQKLTACSSKDFNLCAVKLTCSIININQSGLINIIIDNQLKDNIQNLLKDKISISLNKR